MSAYPSLLSPLMDATGKIAAQSINDATITAISSGVLANEKVDILQITALQESAGSYTGLPATNITAQGTVISQVSRGNAFSSPGFIVSAAGSITSNSLSTLVSPGVYGNIVGGAITATTEVVAPIFRNNSDTFITDALGNCTVNQLNYTTLNPPIAPGSVPTIEQVLTAGNDCNLKSITNATTIQCNQGFFTNVGTNSASVNILNQGRVAYHNITANASGLDLNTKWTSDGLVLHKVSTGSDITIQNDANNLITLGTSSGLADLQVGTLKYDALDPAISGGWVGTATSDLNMADYGITNTSSLQFKNGTGDGVITMPPNESTLDFDGLDINSIGNIVCNSVTTGILNIVVDSVQVASLSESGLGVVGSVVADGGVTGLTLNSSLATGDGAIANYDNSFSVHSNGNITCPLINAVAPQFKPTYDYYVAKNGSDSGLGSILSPFLTVQHAIDVCETAYDGIPRVIHLASGTFSENLLFSKSRISIVGEGTSMNPDVGSSIAGTITINITSGVDMNNSNIYFDGLLINGEIQDNTNSFVHRLFFTNCYLYANSRCLLMNVIGDYRLFVDRCNISNSSTSAINALVQCLGTGMISITNSKLTSKGLEQMTCVISVSCRTDLFANNILTSDSTSTTAPAILWLGTSATVSIGNCAFIYSSSAAKSNATAAGIRLTSSGSLVIVQSFFSLAGLPVGQNAIQNGGVGVVIFGNNISSSSAAGTSAFAISGTLNGNKFPMTAVN